MTRRRTAALVSLAVGISVVAGPRGHAQKPTTVNWALHNLDLGGTRYSTLDQINTTNIDKLGGAWSIHLEEQGAAVGGLDGTPIVIGGVMYVTTPRLHVLALDAATGAIRGTRAVAVHTGRVPHAARLRPSDGAISALVAW